MVLKGETRTTPEMPPTIIPELQNRSIISVVHSHSYPGFLNSSHFSALTSSGKLLTWGEYSEGALGLGDPGKLPAGSPGGYAKEEQRVRALARTYYTPPPEVTVPTEVRFDHGLRSEGKVERYCFAMAAGGLHMGALVIDLGGDEVPPEDLKQYV